MGRWSITQNQTKPPNSIVFAFPFSSLFYAVTTDSILKQWLKGMMEQNYDRFSSGLSTLAIDDPRGRLTLSLSRPGQVK
ncbi:hypothetical protein C5167_013858 [Papaver somniferum]|uniref:Uncharacterized protein n=1 Tax=Papaver somniferum TaxID=3469 RepID=A0A4Y7J1J4_PAPSO|nr:hypothetical protein C5167_013858 [Papaver somniferum]